MQHIAIQTALLFIVQVNVSHGEAISFTFQLPSFQNITKHVDIVCSFCDVLCTFIFEKGNAPSLPGHLFKYY